MQEAHLGAVPHARQVLLAVGVSHELTTASQPPSRVYDMLISDKKIKTNKVTQMQKCRKAVHDKGLIYSSLLPVAYFFTYLPVLTY